MHYIPKRAVFADTERDELCDAAEREQTTKGVSGFMACNPRRDDIPVGIAKTAHARLPNPAADPLQQQREAKWHSQQEGQQLETLQQRMNKKVHGSNSFPSMVDE